MDAYSLLGGVETLALRLERQNYNAVTIVSWVRTRRASNHVNYPGLEAHRHDDVAKRQMRGFGGMLNFSVRGELGAIQRILRRLH